MAEKPERVRVVLAGERRSRPDPAAREIEEQTLVGEALVRGLVRAQLALALRLRILVGAVLRQPAAAVRGGARAVAGPTCAGVPLPWLLLGFLAYPFICRRGLALRPHRRAQRARLRRPWSGPTGVDIAVRACPAIVARHPRHGRHRRATACGSPAPRSDFLVASRTVSPRWNAAAICGRVPLRGVASSASPGWCSSTASTCSGTRSASPPATWRCCCSSPRRCAARAPTRCPTSPRSGCDSRPCARLATGFVVFIGWLYLVPQLQGAGLTLRR